MFEGNTADPMTLAAQIDKLKQRFKLQRIVMVGDPRVDILLATPTQLQRRAFDLLNISLVA